MKRLTFVLAVLAALVALIFVMNVMQCAMGRTEAPLELKSSTDNWPH
jgi:hypothetical protein